MMGQGMNKKAAFPGPGPASVNLVIVGAGRGGRSIIGLSSKNEMVRILKVVDINAEAPGMLLAEEMNIPSSLTYSDLAGRSDQEGVVLVDYLHPRGVKVDPIVEADEITPRRYLVDEHVHGELLAGVDGAAGLNRPH